MYSKKLISLFASCLLVFSSLASAEMTSNYGTYGAPEMARAQGACTRWFLFFCIARDGETVGQSQTQYRPVQTRRQPLEPAMTQHIPGGNAPILGPFNRAFQQCCRGGSYTSLGIWGDERHKRRRSCHNSGSAIDISAVRCPASGSARAGSKKFWNFVNCMNGREGLYTIHGRKDHFGHVDIALRSCQKGGRGKIRIK